MIIKKVKIKNFRSYKDEIEINFCELTAFVGKNDIGKSTILEALDIFFNDGDGLIKINKDDINKKALEDDITETVISVCFDELPQSIIIDSTIETRLKDEYLLNSNNQLEIIKKFSNGGKEKVFVKANHPMNTNCNDLLQKRNTELQKIINDNAITCSNLTINSKMRTSIWQYYFSDLQLSEIEIDVTKGDTKSIWDKLQTYLPIYSLFQADRKNSDGDDEIQDPLKQAVKQILNDAVLKVKFEEIANEVKSNLQKVATRTLEKIKEMNPEIAISLKPLIPATDNLKWAEVFKSVSITGEDNIPINKRGSGVKRLILFNFFRAEVERIKSTENIQSIIYAIEEPETSQHTENQKKFAKTLLELSKTVNIQIIITTHSSSFVKELEFKHIRIIRSNNFMKIIDNYIHNILPNPSLNEVNYLAFSEISEEYHNELYGFIIGELV